MLTLSTLNDDSLIEYTSSLVSKERGVTVKLLHYLIEIERRELFLKLGFSSMFAFATKKLQYSEAQALRRIRAARCLKESPEIEELLLDGRLSLCTVALAFKELKSEKKAEVIEKLSGASKREAELILSEGKPMKVVRDKIKPLGNLAPKKEDLKEALPLLVIEPTVPGNGEKEVLKPQLHHVQFSAKDDFLDKLNEVQSLISNKFPTGASLEEIFAECMEVYLNKKCPKRRLVRREKRKTKAVAKRVTTRKPSRTVPADIRDLIINRDKGRCSYVAPDGTRCCSKHDLEIDHIMPFAIGGTSEPDNLRLLCRKHNQLEAKRVFGEGMIEACI